MRRLQMTQAMKRKIKLLKEDKRNKLQEEFDNIQNVILNTAVRVAS